MEWIAFFIYFFPLAFPSLLSLITGPLICAKIGMNCNESGLIFHRPLVQTWETGYMFLVLVFAYKPCPFY